MDYQHETKAGNRADVWKHFILLNVLESLLAEHPPKQRFHYAETHAGAGRYDLAAHGEWESGIARLAPDQPADIVLDAANSQRLRRYDGSWLRVAERLRACGVDFYLRLCERDHKVAAIAAALAAQEGLNGHYQIMRQDGYADCRDSPPAHLTLLDPPYTPHGRGDWPEVEKTLRRLHTRPGVTLLWYPLYGEGAADALLHAKRHSWELHWREADNRCAMWGCGVMAQGLHNTTTGTLNKELAALARSMDGHLVIRRAQI